MGAIATQGFAGLSGRAENFNVAGAGTTFYIDGKDSHDFIVVSNGANDHLTGGLGQDVIEGWGGDDTIIGDQFWNDETTNANVELAAAADILFGDFIGVAAAGRDTIYAGGGNNFVNAGGNDDYVLGGSGNELLQGGTGNDTIIGLAGDDRLWGGTAGTTQQQTFLTTNFGSNISYTFDGTTDAATNVNTTPASFGQEEVLTNTGNDWLDAGAGNDQAFGQDGDDYIIGGDGNDYLEGNDGNDIVAGQNDNDTIYGNAGNDWLEGNKGNDIIIGGIGNDRIEGGEGTDWIEGGAGYDLLFGGAGNDTFIFHASDIQVGNWATVADLGKVEGDFDGIVLEGFGPNHANVAFYQDGANTLIYSLSTGLGGGIIVQNITIAELQAHLGFL